MTLVSQKRSRAFPKLCNYGNRSRRVRTAVFGFPTISFPLRRTAGRFGKRVTRCGRNTFDGRRSDVSEKTLSFTGVQKNVFRANEYQPNICVENVFFIFVVGFFSGTRSKRVQHAMTPRTPDIYESCALNCTDIAFYFCD